MHIIVSKLTSGIYLDWLVGSINQTNGVRPATCRKCPHILEHGIQDGSVYYCNRPNTDLQWESDSSSNAPDYGVHEDCPINEYTPEPYSTKWSLSENIITELLEEGFSFQKSESNEEFVMRRSSYCVDTEGYGNTPLVAAMKCYVMHKLGEVVEAPDELINAQSAYSNY